MGSSPARSLLRRAGHRQQRGWWRWHVPVADLARRAGGVSGWRRCGVGQIETMIDHLGHQIGLADEMIGYVPGPIAGATIPVHVRIGPCAHGRRRGTERRRARLGPRPQERGQGRRHDPDPRGGLPGRRRSRADPDAPDSQAFMPLTSPRSCTLRTCRPTSPTTSSRRRPSPTSSSTRSRVRTSKLAAALEACCRTSRP